MASTFRPPMYRAKKGRKLPKSAYEEQPETTVEKPAEKPAEKSAKKPGAKAEKKPAKKPAEKADKPKAKRKVKWAADYTKEDLYWIAKKLEIDKIKSRTPKSEMIKILRRHPGAEEKK